MSREMYVPEIVLEEESEDDEQTTTQPEREHINLWSRSGLEDITRGFREDFSSLVSDIKRVVDVVCSMNLGLPIEVAPEPDPRQVHRVLSFPQIVIICFTVLPFFMWFMQIWISFVIFKRVMIRLTRPFD